MPYKYQSYPAMEPKNNWVPAPSAGRDPFSGATYIKGTLVVFVHQTDFAKSLPAFLINRYVLPSSYAEMVSMKDMYGYKGTEAIEHRSTPEIKNAPQLKAIEEKLDKYLAEEKSAKTDYEALAVMLDGAGLRVDAADIQYIAKQEGQHRARLQEIHQKIETMLGIPPHMEAKTYRKY